MRISHGDAFMAQKPQVGYNWRQPETLRISSLHNPSGDTLSADPLIPSLLIRGMWLYRWGFKAGSRVRVTMTDKSMTLTLMDETVPYRYQRHPKKKRGNRFRRWLRAALDWWRR
jgi:hypothetical protein